MKFALKLLLWKMESTYGTDPVPTNTSNVLVAQNVDINPLEMETDDYTPVSDTFGSNEMIIGAKWSTVSFDVLLCGSGTQGTAPNHGVVQRACSRSELLSAGLSATYSLVSQGEESATCYFYVNGVLQKISGLKGSFTETWTAKKAPRMTFKGIGLHVPMVDASLPIPTLPSIPRPVAMNATNTEFRLDAPYEANVSSFSLDLGNDVQYRNLTGRERVDIVGRQPSGKIMFEMPTVAGKNFLGANGLCTLATPVNLSVIHGTVPGNILERSMPKVQLMKPRAREERGILMLECDLHLAREDGNDEITDVWT